MPKYRIVALSNYQYEVQVRDSFSLWIFWRTFGYSRYHSKKAAKEMIDFLIERDNIGKVDKQKGKEFIRNNPPEYYP